MLRALCLGQATLQVTLVSDSIMRRQNFRHRGISQTTDVLSFPALPPQSNPKIYKNRFLGDVLVSLDRARLQAKVQKISLADEVLFLVIHSLLHLLGHDHAEPLETKRMQAIESHLWSLCHDL